MHIHAARLPVPADDCVGEDTDAHACDLTEEDDRAHDHSKNPVSKHCVCKIEWNTKTCHTEIRESQVNEVFWQGGSMFCPTQQDNDDKYVSSHRHQCSRKVKSY